MKIERSMLNLFYVFSNFDRESEPYDRAGIALTCEVVVPMSTVPPFVQSFADGAPPQAALFPVEKYFNRRALDDAFDSGDFIKIHRVSLEALKSLSGDHRTHCLTRHFVESIAMTANKAPELIAASQKAGLADPSGILSRMIQGHLLYLSAMMKLDNEARPIQAAGIPIFCQDIPKIPFLPLK